GSAGADPRRRPRRARHHPGQPGRAFLRGMADQLEAMTFLDLDQALVERVLERERLVRRSGPAAEAILREVGAIAAKIV
ncbi:MAG TPA: hypothetical protein PLY96_12880, partial [Chromatiaceae bacterium]|nr:hypothetical protein [Chromatiaceae bacterium]